MSIGEISGLLARGGFEIGLKWEKKQLQEVRVLAKQTGVLVIQYSDKRFQQRIKKGTSIKLNKNLIRI
ncbi:glycoside hydrolase family 95-like protein [Sinomicrobium sp. M5D2P17]